MRTILYSVEAPQGRLFTDEEELRMALRDGWVEAPWLVNDARPHEPVIDDVPDDVPDDMKKQTKKSKRK